MPASLAYEASGGVFYVGAANEPQLRGKSWAQLGGEAALQVGAGPEVFVYGRNLTDERFLSFAARVAPASAFLVISDPRTYGAGIRYRF